MREYRGKPLSVVTMLARNWKYNLFIGIVFGFASYIFINQGDTGYCLFLAGAFFGLLLRDIAWFRITARFWPVSDAVTDWEKVDALIEENES